MNVLKLYLKIYKEKTHRFMLVNEISSTIIPSCIDKASIKTWKNNGFFSCGPLYGLTPSSLIN